MNDQQLWIHSLTLPSEKTAPGRMTAGQEGGTKWLQRHQEEVPPETQKCTPTAQQSFLHKETEAPDDQSLHC